MNIYQERGLKNLCDSAVQGLTVSDFLTKTENTSFEVRTGGPSRKNESE